MIFLRAVLLLTLVQATRFPVCAATPSPPNIVFILTDDQAWDALGKVSPEIQTPHLDRLAEKGLLLTHAYNMGAWTGAVCVASRTMMVTGRSLWHCRQIDQALAAYRSSPPSARTQGDAPNPGSLWSEWMKEAGYRTYFTGKWHISLKQPREVFDIVGTVRGGMPKDTPDAYHRPVENGRDGQAWSPWDQTKGGHWAGGRHWTAVVADEAIEFLGQASTRNEPYFMYLAFSSPHDPRQAPREFVERYPLDAISLPPNAFPDYPYRSDIGLPDSQRDERLAPHPRTDHALRTHRQEYFALVTYLDGEIGRILDAIEASPAANNTLIVFTSDHGLAIGRHGLLGKGNMFEHSLRAPIILAGPGIPRGARSDARVYLQDLVPTILEIAGARVPDFMEFQSLRPIIEDPSRPGRDAIYAAYFGYQRAVIEGDWKLIHYPLIKRTILYNLEKDPHEMHDLAADPEQTQRVIRLHARLDEQMRLYDDPLLFGEDLRPSDHRLL